MRSKIPVSVNFRRFRARVAILLLLISITVYVCIFLLSMGQDHEVKHYYYNLAKDLPKRLDRNYPILLWWTPFTGEQGVHKRCGTEICFFTERREYFTDNLTMALLFYGSDFKPTDLPLPRLSHHDWALLHEESPKNNYLFSTEKVMSLFNHTATFRHTSHLPLTLQYLDSLESLISKKFFVPTEAKNSRLHELAPVVYVHSDCDTPSDRDAYVSELMKYIKIDSYGKCLHNKDLPSNLTDPINGMNAVAFLQIISEYKFALAFENAICDDYITEKLWRPLVVGSVPVYYGSPTVQIWLPNHDSAIIATEFESPMHLAAHLLKLNNNNAAYESHLKHKIHQKISNSRLIQTITERKWGINNELTHGSFIDHFECLVCERTSKNLRRSQNSLPKIVYNAGFNHYGCPKPISMLTRQPDPQNWWLELYLKAHQEAKALEHLISSGKNYSSDQFYQEVIRLLESEGIS